MPRGVLSVIRGTHSISKRSLFTTRNTVSGTKAGGLPSGLEYSILANGSGEKFERVDPLDFLKFSFIQVVSKISLAGFWLNIILGAMELRIVKPSFKYTPGQWLFLQVPELSLWQWHPVRESSNEQWMIQSRPDYCNSLQSRLHPKIHTFLFTFVRSETSLRISAPVWALVHLSLLQWQLPPWKDLKKMVKRPGYPEVTLSNLIRQSRR